MKMAFLYAFIAFFTIISGSDSASDTPKPPPSDSDLLQGTWNWNPDAEQSKAVPRIDVVKIVIKGKRITFHYAMEDQVFESEHEIEFVSTAVPKTCDMKSLEKEKLGKVTTLGIYEVTGRSLKICYRGSESTRPKSFDDVEDGNNVTTFLSLIKSK